MEKTLDLRGLSCPIPLIRTRDALAAEACVTVIVDEPAPKENILKFAKAQGYSAECKEESGEYTLVIRK
ncbi:MAG TPA: sulfurtransferase TusA family protein [Selenomonadales bacterium]|nr:sulfurtransferase TusA family protein [Selenomonadales bacterium]